MRYRKTPQNKRNTYRLYNENGGLILELKPGINNITPEDIKKLHAVDDHEVYINCKERLLSPFEQKTYDEWKDTHDTENVLNAHRQQIPLDDNETDSTDEYLSRRKSDIQYELSRLCDDEPVMPVLLLRELVLDMPERWQQVYRLAMLMEYSNVETASMLGITEARVRALRKKIKERILDDEKIRSFFE